MTASARCVPVSPVTARADAGAAPTGSRPTRLSQPVIWFETTQDFRLRVVSTVYRMLDRRNIGDMMKTLLTCLALILASNSALEAKDICDDAYDWTVGPLNGNTTQDAMRTLLDMDSAREVFLFASDPTGGAQQVEAKFYPAEGPPEEINLLANHAVAIVRIAKKLEVRLVGNNGASANGCFKWSLFP